MSGRSDEVTGLAPGGGEPPEGGSPEAGAKAPRQRPKARPRRRKKRATLKSYTDEQRIAAVEAYFKSGLSQSEFSRVWGVNPGTFSNWLYKYKQGGPQALARKPRKTKGQLKTPKAVQAEILTTKKDFPSFGLRKMKDYLFRFRSVKVSPTTIKKTLEAEDFAATTHIIPRRSRRKGKKKVRRFERAKPGLLWQSDITSFLLPRHGQRCYLTVFLDDHSRYVVSFALAMQQRQDLVTEALLVGIDRFGKPEEVLTDQGRQYYAWRGRSGFRKLLDKQGIKHVVARSHHPQTVGLCASAHKWANARGCGRPSRRNSGVACSPRSSRMPAPV